MPTAAEALAPLAASAITSSPLVDIFQPAAFAAPRLRPLFGHALLTAPDGLAEMARRALSTCRMLVDRIHASAEESSPGSHLIVQRLDRISDTLCQVLDLCEFVRSVDPRDEYARVADEVFVELHSYMNELNTDQRLYAALDRFINSSRSGDDAIELDVARQFRWDFQQSGVHLSASSRRQFVVLSDRIGRLSQAYLSTSSFAKEDDADGKRMVSVSVADIPPSMIESNDVHIINDRAWISANSHVAMQLLRRSMQEQTRRDVYLAGCTADPQEMAVLVDLIQTRSEIATLASDDATMSFARYYLQDKLLKTPEAVQRFLAWETSRNRPGLARECEELLAVKKMFPHADGARFYPWDREFCLAQRTVNLPTLTPIRSYLDSGRVVAGLARLLQTLFGISVEPDALQGEQTWHRDVRKLVIRDAERRLLGHIYLDLFERDGKDTQHGAVHYTVRCARRIFDEETTESPSAARASWTMRTSAVSGKESVPWQTPIVALVASFRHPSSAVGLSLTEIETLFHEFGHALHTMLGQTEFQHTSGTRCAADLVELPSVLLERFVRDERVMVPMMKCENQTRAFGVFREHVARNRGGMPAIETQLQVDYAALDLHLHSLTVADSAAGIGGALAAYCASNQHQNMPRSSEDTRWLLAIPHMASYPASYYAYPLAKFLSEHVWRKLFACNPESSSAGERLRHSLLCWGGTRDGWTCIGELLQDASIANGDIDSLQ